MLTVEIGEEMYSTCTLNEKALCLHISFASINIITVTCSLGSTISHLQPQLPLP